MRISKSENDALWVECPSGLIQEVASSKTLDRAYRDNTDTDTPRRQFIVAAATAAGIAVVGGVSYLATRNTEATPDVGGGAMAVKAYGGIDCIDVAKVLPLYIGGEIKDQVKVSQIKTHLQMCESCRESFEYQSANNQSANS